MRDGLRDRTELWGFPAGADAWCACQGQPWRSLIRMNAEQPVARYACTLGMQALRGPLEALGLTTAAQFVRVFAEAKQAMESPGVGCVAPFYLAYGQRPG